MTSIGHVIALERDQSVEAFISRALPWPDENEPGYGNLHWMPKGTTGQGKMYGRAYTKPADLLAQAQWLTANGKADAVYFCMSRQALPGKQVHGALTAVRSAKNATHTKSLWIDIDVKQDEKHYRSTEEAVAAVTQFCKDADMPRPSAYVLSGSGGLHVYWISLKALPIHEWLPYAEGLEILTKKHGLKCDAGLTTDSARILRMPNTYNCKMKPPVPCRLFALFDDYDFDQTIAHIKAPVTAAVTTALCDLAAFPARAPVADERLTERLELHDKTPLEPDNLFKVGGCPHFQNTLRDRGKGVQQGVWMLDVLASTFLKDGDQIAHMLSDGYSAYTAEETDKMIARKRKERDEHSLGWPSCTSFENMGAPECATCPLRGKIRSPLHLCLSNDKFPHADQMAPARLGSNPIGQLQKLLKRGVDLDVLRTAMNATYAVTRYGPEIVVAIIGTDLVFMKTTDFHKMFANLRIGPDQIPLSQLWFNWEGRRQYLGRGVIFEPGAPLEVPNDMLNLWRGLGVVAKGWRLVAYA